MIEYFLASVLEEPFVRLYSLTSVIKPVYMNI
jgi:hypothetical protein